MAIGFESGKVRLFDVQNARAVNVLEVTSGQEWSRPDVSISNDGRLLCAVVRRSEPVETAEILNVLPIERLVLGKVYIWNIEDGSPFCDVIAVRQDEGRATGIVDGYRAHDQIKRNFVSGRRVILGPDASVLVHDETTHFDLVTIKPAGDPSLTDYGYCVVSPNEDRVFTATSDGKELIFQAVPASTTKSSTKRRRSGRGNESRPNNLVPHEESSPE